MVVKGFYDVTVELIGLLRNKEGVTDRDSLIQQVEVQLNKRQEFQNEMNPPFNEEDKQLAKKIMELTPELNLLLQKVKMDTLKDIKSLQEKKKTASKYSNPYEALETDGVFYDKRK